MNQAEQYVIIDRTIKNLAELRKNLADQGIYQGLEAGSFRYLFGDGSTLVWTGATGYTVTST